MSPSSSFKPHSRARIVTLRPTSVPLRSSLGSGSVKPLFLASFTTSEYFMPGFHVLKMYERVPLKMPSTFVTSSPAFSSVCSGPTIGNPAPTVASYRKRLPPFRAAAMIFSYREYGPAPARLFGVATCAPAASQASYMSAGASEAVLSTIMARPPLAFAAASTKSVSLERSASTSPLGHAPFAKALSPPGASSTMVFERATAVICTLTPRSFSNLAALASTCDTSSLPTKP
mmetsp:Transcript_57167/g.185136  ORF Transcript_57167/g.185136 Transcript_57167/m.185136 type:complete len:231 (-) Transcript_57167:332-1024(-)